MKNNNNHGAEILIWGVNIFLIFLVLGYIALLVIYGDKPMSEMPIWVWYLLK